MDIAKLISHLRGRAIRLYKNQAKDEKRADSKTSKWMQGAADNCMSILEEMLELGANIPVDHELIVEAETLLPKISDLSNHELSRTLHWYRNNTKDGRITKESLWAEKSMRAWVGRGRAEVEEALAKG